MSRDSSEGFIGIGVFFGVLVGILVMTMVKIPGCVPDYSTGARSGVVMKLANKGLVLKSYEGELKMVTTGQAGQAINAQDWDFSCLNADVVKKLQAAMDSGKAVSVSYRQWLIKPWKISTTYEITDVKDIGEQPKVP
jgi:hypothetical protein